MNTIRLCNFDTETVTIFKKFVRNRYASHWPPSLYYFPYYGRAEPIRMAYWKAGIKINEVKIGKEWP